jgi:hypothetical protein
MSSPKIAPIFGEFNTKEDWDQSTTFLAISGHIQERSVWQKSNNQAS